MDSLESPANDIVTLVLDDTYEVVASRSRLVDSCFYFQCLLAGPYKESGQSRIEIKSQGMFDFDVFEAVVRYANERAFIRDDEKLELHFGMIGLAIFWAYDELINLLESYLIGCLNLNNCADIHGLANYHDLKKLQEECIRFENSLEQAMGPLRRRTGRCALDGHENHHYSTCSSYSEHLKRSPIEDEDWDSFLPKTTYAVWTIGKREPKLSQSKENKRLHRPINGHWTKTLSS